MKKIISFALVLTFVLAMFTCSFADSEIPGVLHQTGEWVVSEDGNSVTSMDAGSILVLDRTATAGTFEVTMSFDVIKAGKMPAVFLQGAGYENVTEFGDPKIESAATDSVMIWPQAGRVVITDMNKGQYRDVHTFIAYADILGAEWAETATELTLKFEFDNGALKTYLNGELGATSTYSARGNQIAFRGKIIADDTNTADVNEFSGAVFSNVKLDGEQIFFAEKPVQTGDATVIAVATVSFAVLACGAVLTISKKRIAE